MTKQAQRPMTKTEQLARIQASISALSKQAQDLERAIIEDVLADTLEWPGRGTLQRVAPDYMSVKAVYRLKTEAGLFECRLEGNSWLAVIRVSNGASSDVGRGTSAEAAMRYVESNVREVLDHIDARLALYNPLRLK